MGQPVLFLLPRATRKTEVPAPEDPPRTTLRFVASAVLRVSHLTLEEPGQGWRYLEGTGSSQGLLMTFWDFFLPPLPSHSAGTAWLSLTATPPPSRTSAGEHLGIKGNKALPHGLGIPLGPPVLLRRKIKRGPSVSTNSLSPISSHLLFYGGRGAGVSWKTPEKETPEWTAADGRISQTPEDSGLRLAQSQAGLPRHTPLGDPLPYPGRRDTTCPSD